MREILNDKMFRIFIALIVLGVAINLLTSDLGIEVIGAVTAIGGVFGLIFLKLIIYS
jgi:hypothetical protein